MYHELNVHCKNISSPCKYRSLVVRTIDIRSLNSRHRIQRTKFIVLPILLLIHFFFIREPTLLPVMPVFSACSDMRVSTTCCPLQSSGTPWW